MRKHVTSSAVVVTLLVAVLSSIAVPTSSAREVPETSSTKPQVTITHIDGVQIKEREVTKGEGFYVLPNTVYLDEGFYDEQLEKKFVEEGLKSVDVLKQWSLCAYELRAEAKIRRGSAAAIYAFPHNAPLNEADRYGNVNKDDAEYAAERRSTAVLYDQAAQLAEEAGVACSSPSSSPQAGNYARFMGPDATGVRRTLDIPDYSVVRLPVEYFLFAGDCAADAARWLKKLQATPVAAKPGKRGDLDTFTERDKAFRATIHRAHHELLQKVHAPC